MEAIQQVLSVTFVLALLGASLWWLRRRGLAQFSSAPRRRSGGILTQVERLPLAPGTTLHLVRMADRAVLISVSPGGCRLLESLPWSDITSSSKGDLA